MDVCDRQKPLQGCYLPIYLSIYLSIHLSIYLLIYLPNLPHYIHINECISIYLYIYRERETDREGERKSVLELARMTLLPASYQTD